MKPMALLITAARPMCRLCPHASLCQCARIRLTWLADGGRCPPRAVVQWLVIVGYVASVSAHTGSHRTLRSADGRELKGLRLPMAHTPIGSVRLSVVVWPSCAHSCAYCCHLSSSHLLYVYGADWPVVVLIMMKVMMLACEMKLLQNHHRSV